jgi:hypothetical protein
MRAIGKSFKENHAPLLKSVRRNMEDEWRAGKKRPACDEKKEKPERAGKE